MFFGGGHGLPRDFVGQPIASTASAFFTMRFQFITCNDFKKKVHTYDKEIRLSQC